MVRHLRPPEYSAVIVKSRRSQGEIRPDHAVGCYAIS